MGEKAEGIFIQTALVWSLSWGQIDFHANMCIDHCARLDGENCM